MIQRWIQDGSRQDYLGAQQCHPVWHFSHYHCLTNLHVIVPKVLMTDLQGIDREHAVSATQMLIRYDMVMLTVLFSTSVARRFVAGLDISTHAGARSC